MEGNFQIEELLNNVQKKGLKYYDDLTHRIPREEIEIYDKQIQKVFDTGLSKIMSRIKTSLFLNIRVVFCVNCFQKMESSKFQISNKIYICLKNNSTKIRDKVFTTIYKLQFCHKKNHFE